MPRRRIFQFSLQTFLLAVTVFAGWLGWRLEQARRRGLTIDAIVKAGATVSYGEDSPVVLFSSHRSMSHYWEDVRNLPVDVQWWAQYDAAVGSQLRLIRNIHRLEIGGCDVEFDDLERLKGVCDIVILHDCGRSLSYAHAEALHRHLPGTTIVCLP